MTRSLCSQCLSIVDAKILKTADNQIILRKWCTDHGFESCLIHSDAEWYFHAQKFNRPGDIPHLHATYYLHFDCSIASHLD